MPFQYIVILTLPSAYLNINTFSLLFDFNKSWTKNAGFVVAQNNGAEFLFDMHASIAFPLDSNEILMLYSLLNPHIRFL